MSTSATVGAATDTVPTVTAGVFFRPPAGLPRGRHALPQDEVRDTQRERLMIAVTELLAHGGYAQLGVRAVTARAGVSATTFYRCVDDLDQLLFAAYDRFIEVVLGRLLAVPISLPWDEHLEAIVTAYLEVLEEDPVVGRAFQVEMDALGAPARQRRREALGGLAALLEQRHADWLGLEHAPNPSSHYLAAVYAVRQLAADLLDDEAAPDLRSLLPDFLALTERVFRPDATGRT